MRVLLLALMIALLPLRGWVGDAFAMQMTPVHCLAMKNIATSQDSTGARGHFDVDSEFAHTGGPNLASALADGSVRNATLPDPAPQGYCSHSSACLIYQVAAVVTSVHFYAAAAPSHLLWPAGGVSFASVSLAPSLKPPIS